MILRVHVSGQQDILSVVAIEVTDAISRFHIHIPAKVSLHRGRRRTVRLGSHDRFVAKLDVAASLWKRNLILFGTCGGGIEKNRRTNDCRFCEQGATRHCMVQRRRRGAHAGEDGEHLEIRRALQGTCLYDLVAFFIHAC